MKTPSLSDYFQLHFIVLIWGFTAILGKLLEPMDSLGGGTVPYRAVGG